MTKSNPNKKAATVLTIYLFALLAVAAGAIVIRLIMYLFGV